jgi:hypothetical protein
MSKFLSDAWMYENGFVDEKVSTALQCTSTTSADYSLGYHCLNSPLFIYVIPFDCVAVIYGANWTLLRMSQ